MLIIGTVVAGQPQPSQRFPTFVGHSSERMLSVCTAMCKCLSTLRKDDVPPVRRRACEWTGGAALKFTVRGSWVTAGL